MHYRIHPPFLEEAAVQIEQNQKLAYLAQVEDLLMEFENSEEFRACSVYYLQSPKIILKDFIYETGLAPDLMDTEALAHGLFSVIPSRVLGLTPDDADQIFREQLSFWAFVDAHWQFKYAHACLEYLDLRALRKLSKIISLEHSPLHFKHLLNQPGSHFLQPGDNEWRAYPLQEQDVFSIDRFSEL